METSSIIGLPELGIMGDPNFFHQWNLSSMDTTSISASTFGETLQKLSFSNSNFNPKTCMETERPQETLGDQNFVFKDYQEAKMIGTRPKHSTPHEHVLAERKRREKLSQRFIDLSALVPGLKKMDKASVLGDAIKYLKQMQEKVSSLEEEQKRKKTVESVVFVKRSIISNTDDSDTGGPFDEALPEIEARVCERNVLIRVHCEKKKGVIEKTISEIEKLHLKVINTSALAFGSFALDITIVAQMDVEFSMTVKDLVRELRSAFASFI